MVKMLNSFVKKRKMLDLLDLLMVVMVDYMNEMALECHYLECEL